MNNFSKRSKSAIENFRVLLIIFSVFVISCNCREGIQEAIAAIKN